MDKVIISVDAGGTKTKAAAITKDANIIFEYTAGPGSPAVLRFQALNNIKEAIKMVYNEVKDNYEITCIQVGASGYGVFENVSKIEEDLSKEFGVYSYICSDADLGLYSIIEDKYEEGILVLAGTGSAIAGIKDGKTMLVGGFGALLTEVGSSYTAVKSLVMNIINQYEEDLTYSELGSEFMKLIGADSIAYFRKFMYLNTKDEIASYAKFISKSALKGNEEAINILKQSGIDLANSVRKLYNNLKLSSNAIMGFRGSFIQKAPYVKEELVKALNDFGIYVKVCEEDKDPIYGGLFMAIRRGKI